MREIDFSDLKVLLQQRVKPILVDCRAEEYWLWETIRGSQNLRWKEVGQRAANVLPDKNAPIVTFCQSLLCPASSKAYDALEKLSYTNLYEYSGGLEDWRARDGEVVRASEFRISDFSFRFPRQFFHEQPVGSYLIEDEEFIVLLDGPQELTDANEDFILSFAKPIRIFLTHGPTGGAAEILREKHNAEILLHSDDATNPWLRCSPTRLLGSDEQISDNLRIIHTPGHTPGSACLLDQRTRILYSGDHFQGKSPGVAFDFRDSTESPRDFAEQFRSLRKIAEFEFHAIHPFHYSPIPIEAKSILAAFLASIETDFLEDPV